MQLTELEAAIEAVLFAAGEAVSLARLALALEREQGEVKAAAEELIGKYKQETRGIEMIAVAESYQLRTNPVYYTAIQSLFQNPQKKALTQPLIETLAIIAYRQPVTKPQIEDVRGVNADHAVNRLIELGLVCERGRDTAPGKAILFGTTDDFLKHFGFTSAKHLPALPETSEQLRLEAETEADEIIK